MEIEKLIENERDIVCLTETHLKFDKYNTSKGLKIIESHREINDRKGGGLMVIFKESKVEIDQLPAAHKDVLKVQVRINGFQFVIILVYFSVNDSKRNENLRKLSRRNLEKSVKVA